MVKKTPGNDDTKKNEADKEDITKIKVFADKLNKIMFKQVRARVVLGGLHSMIGSENLPFYMVWTLKNDIS